MTTPDFRALCEELVDVCDNPSPPQYKADVLNRTRAALATPPPEPPTDKELLELWTYWNLGWDPQIGAVVMPHPAEYARAVLERWGNL
jgi:hypothetical protein